MRILLHQVEEYCLLGSVFPDVLPMFYAACAALGFVAGYSVVTDLIRVAR